MTQAAARFEGRVAIVTGAATGIGKAIAQKLAAEGAVVVLADIADAEPVARELCAGGARALAVRTDVADEHNQLPKELKVLLINLAAYVNKNSDMIVNSHPDGDLDMLIAINRHVMDGLRGATAA
jgi:NAD(P)-dependent dehydrogenase (short-subunit alcohol dehydrogenase family)